MTREIRFTTACTGNIRQRFWVAPSFGSIGGNITMDLRFISQFYAFCRLCFNRKIAGVSMEMVWILRSNQAGVKGNNTIGEGF